MVKDSKRFLLFLLKQALRILVRKLDIENVQENTRIVGKNIVLPSSVTRSIISEQTMFYWIFISMFYKSKTKDVAYFQSDSSPPESE